MMKIFELQNIKDNIRLTNDLNCLLNSQKSAFIDYSSNLYDVPPPMQFIFSNQLGDSHIKGAYKKGSENLIVKIANSSPSGNDGLILIFDIKTGAPIAIIKDKGYLTTLRTAIAGVCVLDVLPWDVKNIGIIGSGSLAKQLNNLANIKYPNANIMIYARNQTKGLKISSSICNSSDDLIEKCDVIFTATASFEPIINNIPLNRKIAVIALGSDDEHKSELSPEIYENADIVIVDSKSQALKFGDVSKALKANLIANEKLIEFGHILKSGVVNNLRTIIADFSGIGAQDFTMIEFFLSKIKVAQLSEWLDKILRDQL